MSSPPPLRREARARPGTWLGARSGQWLAARSGQRSGARSGRRVGALPGTVLALLVLFARLVAASPMPAANEADAVARAALHTICHAAPDGDRAPDHHPAPDGSHDGCLLCPACHLLAHAAVPVPGGLALLAPQAVPVGAAAPLPPATGPPGRFRPVPHPTGPPASA